MDAQNTVKALLDRAQHLVQERGFNAFSYADLANSVGIRTASIHYHFKTKADLGTALMERYLNGLDQRLAQIEAKHAAPKARLKAFIEIYRETQRQGVVCLCGSLASDVETLREDLRLLVEAYLQRSESWVKTQVQTGASRGDFTPVATAPDLAAFLVSGLQGALLLGRASGGELPLDRIQRAFFKTLQG